MWNPRKSGATLALLLAFTACEAPPKAIGQGRLPAQRRSAQVALGSFTATVDPSAPAGTAQLLELPIQRDGLSGLNSPFTIEVYSPLPARLVTASPNCGGLDTFEGAVRIKNYFQEQLSNVYVEFTDIHGGASTVCNKMAIAPDINSTLNVTPGILDYTNGGDPSAFDVSHLGVYNTDRTANGAGKIVPNGDSSTLADRRPDLGLPGQCQPLPLHLLRSRRRRHPAGSGRPRVGLRRRRRRHLRLLLRHRQSGPTTAPTRASPSRSTSSSTSTPRMTTVAGPSSRPRWIGSSPTRTSPGPAAPTPAPTPPAASAPRST